MSQYQHTAELPMKSAKTMENTLAYSDPVSMLPAYRYVDLVLETSSCIQQIVMLLMSNEPEKELISFYSHLGGHCLLVKDHIARIKLILSSSDDLITRMLDLFESLIIPSLANQKKATCKYPLQQSLNKHWNCLQNRADKIEFAHGCLNNELLADNMFRQTMDAASVAWAKDVVLRYPEDKFQWVAGNRSLPKNRHKPSHDIWRAAQSVFTALANCTKCDCHRIHDLHVRLCVRTYRSSSSDCTKDFSVFLSLPKAIQEARIRTIQESAVQIAINRDIQPPFKRQRSDNQPMAIKRLCEQILKRQRTTSHCLELQVQEDQLFKLRSSERSCFRFDKEKPSISLKQLIRQGSRSLNEKTKRTLAVLLSYTVFHLYGTPWVQPTLDSSKIIFFQTTSCEVPLRPFIQGDLSSHIAAPDNTRGELWKTPKVSVPNVAASDPEDESVYQSDVDPDDYEHPLPSVVAFAVILMELYFARPFEILARESGCELLETIESKKRWLDVATIFRAYQPEIPAAFNQVIDHCLVPATWQNDSGQNLDDEMIRDIIYQYIVLPLEIDLCEAFTYITIEELENIAETMDISNYSGKPKGESLDFHLNGIYTPRSEEASPQECYETCRPKSPTHPALYTKERQQLSTMRHQSGQVRMVIKPHYLGPKTAIYNSTLSEAHCVAENIVLEQNRTLELYDNYTVAIICAMSFEMSAVRFMLDQEHPRLATKVGDSNIYTLGRLSGHNVVITCLPGSQGKVSASNVATNLKRSFSSVKWWLLVGIGGGVPSKTHDIRLGDIVVSMPDRDYNGVVQYDLGRETDQGFSLTGFLCSPPSILRSAVGYMRSEHLVAPNKVDEFISTMLRKGMSLFAYSRPSAELDVLFEPEYSHVTQHRTCNACDTTRVVKRPVRELAVPKIHYGLVASGDRVIKSATHRTSISNTIGDILCFEMEAAGLLSEFPCLVIRGISDYADSHKNDTWQHYAAAAAAGCAKELLSYLDQESLPRSRFAHE